MPPLPNILTLLRLHRSTNGLTDEELDLIASRASVITFEADTPLHSRTRLPTHASHSSEVAKPRLPAEGEHE